MVPGRSSSLHRRVDPLSRTMVAAIFIIMFVYGWNQYLWPMLMTNDERFFTLMRGIKSILQVWVGSQSPDYNEAFALAVLAMLLPVMIVVIFQSGSSRASPKATNKGYRQWPRSTSVRSARIIQTACAPSTMWISQSRMGVHCAGRPSGCGKSTLLRMVAGLEEISRGRLASEAVSSTMWEPADRDIAMVFQNYALYPHMSVRENLEYGLKNRRRRRRRSMLAWRKQRGCCNWSLIWSANRGLSPAGSVNVLPWVVPLCASLRPFSSMNRSRTSMQAARLDARRNQAAATPPWHHLHLCHA